MKTLAILLALSMTGAQALAQTTTEANTSSVKASDVQKPEEKMKDIDDEITNARLRASTGAKAKYSFAGEFSYSGASITNPTSTKRPQLNDGQASADPVKLNGNVSMKYRMTERDHLNVGLGVDYTPSYQKAGSEEPARFGASSPYVTYSRLFKAGDVQNVLSATVSKYTSKEDVEDAHLNASASVSHTAMANIGTSKASIGLYSFYGEEFWSDYDKVPKGSATAAQFGLNPVFEYEISDKMSFRTVSRWLIWTVKADDRNRGALSEQTQSMGLGYAFTRDIYVYPNMQWKWSAMNADRTTVGLSAYINL